MYKSLLPYCWQIGDQHLLNKLVRVHLHQKSYPELEILHQALELLLLVHHALLLPLYSCTAPYTRICLKKIKF